MPDRNKRKLMQDSSDIEMEQTVSKLARYYRLDRKRKVFDIPMHFKKASDLFCSNVDFMDEPKISDKTTDMMVELLNDIPQGYKADLCISIDDYEGFSSRQILRGLNDALHSAISALSVRIRETAFMSAPSWLQESRSSCS